MKSLIKNIINKFIPGNVSTIGIVSPAAPWDANLNGNGKFKEFQKKIKIRYDEGSESAAEVESANFVRRDLPR